MNEFVLSINDYSSFIELCTGLLFAFSGIDTIYKYISERFEQKIDQYIGDFHIRLTKQNNATTTNITDDSYRNAVLISIGSNTIKVKGELIKWIELCFNAPQSLKDTFKKRFEFAYLKIRITASKVAIFGAVILLQMGFTLNKSVFYLSFVSLNLQEFTYKVLFIYSILTFLYICTIFGLPQKWIEKFGSSSTGIFSKNFLFSVVFFTLATLITLILSIYFDFYHFDVWIQNSFTIFSIAIIIFAYPVFILSTFSRFSVILEKYNLQTLHYIKIIINPPTSISISPQPEFNPNGDIKLIRYFIDSGKGIKNAVSHNFRKNRSFPNDFSAFYKCFKTQTITLFFILLFLGFSYGLVKCQLKTLDESITHLIEEANKKQYFILENVSVLDKETVKKELNRFYSPNSPAIDSILHIVERRQKDTLKLYLNKNLSYFQTIPSKKTEILQNKLDYDTLKVKSYEKWYLIWENPKKTKIKLRYQSDTINPQIYILAKNGTWKIIENYYEGKLDTLKK